MWLVTPLGIAGGVGAGRHLFIGLQESRAAVAFVARVVAVVIVIASVVVDTIVFTVVLVVAGSRSLVGGVVDHWVQLHGHGFWRLCFFVEGDFRVPTIGARGEEQHEVQGVRGAILVGDEGQVVIRATLDDDAVRLGLFVGHEHGDLLET